MDAQPPYSIVFAAQHIKTLLADTTAVIPYNLYGYEGQWPLQPPSLQTTRTEAEVEPSDITKLIYRTIVPHNLMLICSLILLSPGGHCSQRNLARGEAVLVGTSGALRAVAFEP